MPMLNFDDYKDRKNLIKKLETAYGNKDIFKQAILKLLVEDEIAVTAFGLYFGYHKKPMTYKAIADQMIISQSYVRNLSYKAFKRLTHLSFRERIWDKCGYDPALVKTKK